MEGSSSHNNPLLQPMLSLGNTHSAGNTPTHARRRGIPSRFRLVLAVTGALFVACLVNNGILMPMDQAVFEWTLKGCPVKILELTTTMEATYQVLLRRCCCCLAAAVCWLTPCFKRLGSISYVFEHGYQKN